MSETKEVATTKQELKPIQMFERQLNSYEKSIVDLLQAHNISPREFMVTTINAIKKTPKLLEADRATLLASILTSAELGLQPNTPYGLSYIIPYNRKQKANGNWTTILEAQFQIGYQGWVEIMLRNPKVEDIGSGIIYENENWYYNPGKREPFSHEPLPPSKRGEPVAVYAIAWLKESNKPKITVIYKEEIEKFKKISQSAASDYSPWNQTEKDPMMWMWRKTALKQLAKELPKTREIERTAQIDNVTEMGGTVRLSDDNAVLVDDIPDNRLAEKAAEKSEAAAESVKNLFDQKG